MPGSGNMDPCWLGTQLSLSTLPESQPFLGWGMSSPSMFLHSLCILHLSNTPSSYFQKLVEFSRAKYIFAFPGALSWELCYKLEKREEELWGVLYAHWSIFPKGFLTTWAKLKAILCRSVGIISTTVNSWKTICYSMPQFPHLQINSVSTNFLNSRHWYKDEWFKRYKSVLRKEKITTTDIWN